MSSNLKIINHAQNEGLGALYERIMLGRLLKKIVKKYQIKSVLEYGLTYTKGFDNLHLFNTCEVTLCDPHITLFQKHYPFSPKPKFSLCSDSNLKPADLIWSFALLQNNPHYLKKMISCSKKFILVLTPNILNFGTPIHLFFHLLEHSSCFHAESGSLSLRTIQGLKSFCQKQNLKILDSGLIDIPWWPDTAFSIAQMKKILIKKSSTKPKKKTKTNPQKLLEKINASAFIENAPLPKFLKIPFAHHNFVLGKI